LLVVRVEGFVEIEVGAAAVLEVTELPLEHLAVVRQQNLN
jgi:hypothetical protein